MDWLLSPIDPSRAHEVGFAISWHARSMVLAWGGLAPLAVLIARYFKVMPGQDWPRDLDNQTWWRSHWMGHSVVVGLSIFGLALVLPIDWSEMNLHKWCGYGVLVATVIQVLLGIFRGHHYDMTKRRRVFELAHKALGYGTLVLAAITILLGLWQANGPVWMWISLNLWWFGRIIAIVNMQKRGMAIDTYQAIWGDDPIHPGNQMPRSGWGVRRHGDTQGDADVRSDRRDRVRSH